MTYPNEENLNEFEGYGESLNSSPYYLEMQRKYEEDLLLISLQKDFEIQQESINFVSPVFENPINIPIRENKLNNQPTNEKNIL